MDKNGRQRVLKLRALLKSRELYGYVLPSSNEYCLAESPKHLRRLEYATGFSGSNGIAIVCLDQLLFFTDGRYLLQAQIELGKDWSVAELACLQALCLPGSIGYDPNVWTKKQLAILASLELRPIQGNLVDSIWEGKCINSFSKVFPYLEYSGRPSASKLSECFEWIKQKGLDFLFLGDCASVNWLLNFRASDLEHTPIALCFAIVGSSKVNLFIQGHQRVSWITEGDLYGVVEVYEILQLEEFASSNVSKSCGFDPSSSTLGMIGKISAMKLVEVENPILARKSIKNALELQFAQERHVEDAVALVESFSHVESCLSGGHDLSEHAIALILESYRKRSKAYLGASFATICGFKGNGAIIHYKPPAKGSKIVQGQGILLIDSGANYLGATTDVTRNLFLGHSALKEVKASYMNVLKAHLALAMARFPVGAVGGQLDAIARSCMWAQGCDYQHSTGHGVGNCLGVHEGPYGLQPGSRSAISEGMILSNEPGFYKQGEYGIRVENLCFVLPCKKHPGFLEFKQLTLVPYCRALMDCSQISKCEREYIASYYQEILHLVVPHLSSSAKAWCLKEMDGLIQNI